MLWLRSGVDNALYCRRGARNCGMEDVGEIDRFNMQDCYTSSACPSLTRSKNFVVDLPLVECTYLYV